MASDTILNLVVGCLTRLFDILFMQSLFALRASASTVVDDCLVPVDRCTALTV